MILARIQEYLQEKSNFVRIEVVGHVHDLDPDDIKISMIKKNFCVYTITDREQVKDWLDDSGALTEIGKLNLDRIHYLLGCDLGKAWLESDDEVIGAP